MMPTVAPAAIVLTGGLSTRMGVDKASLIVDGSRLVDRALAALQDAEVHDIVVAGPEITGLGPQIRTQPDPAGTRQGPLAGIVSGWLRLCADAGAGTDNTLRYDPIVVLACDLPNLTASTITELIEHARTTTHGAVAHDGERDQPLVAAYRPTALDELVTGYEAGQRSVRSSFAGWDLASVQASSAVIGDADCPEDLEGFEVIWPQEPDARHSG